MIFDWYIITLQALENLWQGFLIFLPKIIGAIVVFTIGWFFAVGIGKIVREILRKVRFNKLFESGIWRESLVKAGWKVDAAGFVGAIVKWVLAIVFLLASIEILGMVQFADFLKNVVSWLPNVIVAAAIFIVAVIVADYISKAVRVVVEGMKIGYGDLVEGVIRLSIWTFALLAILIQLGIARELILTLFSGFVAFLTIAGGLAFGLGGKEIATDILRGLQRKVKRD